MKKKQAELVTDSLVMEKDVQTQTEETLDNQELASQEENSESGEEPSQEMPEIEMLINKRTGYWTLNLEMADLKWIKNHCNSKFNFTGPNEAFMLMNCYLGFAAAIARAEQAEKENLEVEKPAVQAASIEACALLINKYEGSGLESAQRLFRIAVALNGPISEMKRLDDIIADLKEKQRK